LQFLPPQLKSENQEDHLFSSAEQKRLAAQSKLQDCIQTGVAHLSGGDVVLRSRHSSPLWGNHPQARESETSLDAAQRYEGESQAAHACTGGAVRRRPHDARRFHRTAK
jgi:hypothetical protein